MVFETPGADLAFLLARVLFGGVVAFMGLNHFMNLGDMAGYAGMKGVPAPRLSVALSGGTLLFGGLSLVTGAVPLLGAGAIAVFMLVSTPKMHDFWNAEGQNQQTEMTQFLKNATMLGAALVFLALAGSPWPYAVDLGLL